MGQSRTEHVMQAIRRLVVSRALLPDERLPSIRRFAERMQVSPSTVVEAYDRLVAQGVIHSRPGSGFYVSEAVAPLELSAMGPALDREVDPFWVSRQSLDAAPDMLKPGCGWMPSEWMPNTAIRKAIRQLARADAPVLSNYGSTQGSKALRRLLAREMSTEGLDIPPEQILLSASGTQAIDLICRFILRPGDTVLVDDPCYFNFQALLKAHQANIVSVPYTTTGPDAALFSAVLKLHTVKLYITNSALHNPTGATMSPKSAHHVLREASRHDVIIIEDNIFSSFEPEPSTRLAALDGLDRVIRIGSFSKTLSASIRCGYIAARADWIDSLVDLQVATNFGGPSPFAAEILFAALSDGSYRKHMESTRRKLTLARSKVTEQLEELDIIPWLTPRGGFYLWCELPAGLDSAQVARKALAQQVVLAPGNVFSPQQSKKSFMRFNVSQMTDARVYDVLKNAM